MTTVVVALVVVATPVFGASQTSGPRDPGIVAIDPEVIGRERDVPEPAGPSAVPGQLLVRFEADAPDSERQRVLSAHGLTHRRDLRLPGLLLADVPPGAVEEALEREPSVVYAEPNFLYRTAADPDDPRFTSGDLWGISKISASTAWDLTAGSSTVVVAVVDTGVDYAHPDLVDNIWTNPDDAPGNGDEDGNGFVDDIHGWDFVDNDADPSDPNGHGTHVAGTIGARGNNAAGITGVNWQVSLMPLRAGSATGELTAADIVDAFAYACTEGAHVVNGSFGGSYSAAIEDAIDACPQSLFVFAAGNGGGDRIGDNNDTSPVYPCSLPAANIICVASSSQTDELSSFSNYGAVAVDLAAPGEKILSTTPQNVLLHDGFEVDLANWETGGTATWQRTSEASDFGGFSVTDSPVVQYANDADAWIQSRAFDFSGGTRCAMDYTIRFALATDDALYVEAANAASGPWTVLGGVPWTGTTSGKFISFTETDLAAFDGDPTVHVRFRLVSDSSGTADGAHIDGVIVRCRGLAAHGADDFIRLNGTSMATPHVAGVAALILARHPNLSLGSVKDAILGGVDAVASLTGLVESGGRLNALGALTVADTRATPFSDIDDSTFKHDIEWLYAAGITEGCTPDLFCPLDPVTREQMASFLVRALGLTDGAGADLFTDDDDSSHEDDIDRLATAEITMGCGIELFCPSANVLREQMASFLVRALGLTAGAGADLFTDDDDSSHEDDIDRLATADIAKGCGFELFCPEASVTREQMAAFLHRAFGD